LAYGSQLRTTDVCSRLLLLAMREKNLLTNCFPKAYLYDTSSCCSDMNFL